MKYCIEALQAIADDVVTQPPGCGDQFLADHPESSINMYYRFLHNVVAKYRLHLVVELGVYMGFGSAHMSIANGGFTKVVGIDKEPHEFVYEILKKYDNIRLIIGDTIESAPLVGKLIKEGNYSGIDLLFIDSTHDGAIPLSEFLIYSSYFAEECLVVCDDISANDNMDHFWRLLPGEKIRLDHLHPKLHEWYPETGFGVSIVRRHDVKVIDNNSS